MLFLSGHTPLGRRGCFPTQEQTTQESGALRCKWNRYCQALWDHIFYKETIFLSRGLLSRSTQLSHTWNRVAKYLKTLSFWVSICFVILFPAPGFEYWSSRVLALARKCCQISENCNTAKGQSCRAKRTNGKNVTNWSPWWQEHGLYYRWACTPDLCNEYRYITRKDTN